jgi:N-acetylmuramoyl-L-alanine amidase
MTPDAIKAALNDLQTLTLTLYGEARGEPVEGIVAIGCLIRNRTLEPKRFGFGYKGVCLKRSQFSCWQASGGKDNYDHLMAVAATVLELGDGGDVAHARQYFQCQFIAQMIYQDLVLESVIGASRHYYSPTAMVPKGREPVWAKGKKPKAAIGHHLFFEGIA